MDFIKSTLYVIAMTSTLMTSRLTLAAPITGKPSPCSNDYWNDPCGDGDRPTDAPSTPSGAEFFKKQAQAYRFIEKCLEWRKQEYIDARIPDNDFLDYLDNRYPHLEGFPTGPNYKVNTNTEEDTLKNATDALIKIAIFNEQIVIDELAFEATSSPFGKYFQEMKGYYRDRLCDLREEMRARRIDAPQCQDLTVIPINLTNQPENRSRRHDRDYFIIRDTQKLITSYALEFARIYSATAKIPAGGQKDNTAKG